jgi:flagellar basal-body rod modification protein FlgD
MTTISTTSGTTSPTSSSSTSSSSTATPTLGYNDFLQLLLAQMQNQDPLNPTDSTQYVSQLASFSNVEQGINMNSKLDQLLVDSNISQASTMVGLTITSADGATTGLVKSVRIDSSGATAVLANGSEVTIGAGVTVSNQ